MAATSSPSRAPQSTTSPAYIYLFLLIATFAVLYNQTREFTRWDGLSILCLVVSATLLWLASYYYSDEAQLRCIPAADGKTFCVRDRSGDGAGGAAADDRGTTKAAELLGQVTAKCSDMVRYMQAKHPDDARVRRLSEGFRADRISETLPTSDLTAYSENKGEKIAFCLNRKKDDDTRLIDINTLTFVALHELSHIMTETVGHNQDFWENFKFLLENAEDAGVYRPVNYKQAPQEYCGMTITDNPYFDLQ